MTSQCRDCGTDISPDAKRCRSCYRESSEGPGNANWKGGPNQVEPAKEEDQMGAREDWRCPDCSAENHELDPCCLECGWDPAETPHANDECSCSYYQRARVYPRVWHRIESETCAVHAGSA